MREPTLKDTGLYSKEEARICLNCSERRCLGTCDRLKRERDRLYKENAPTPICEPKPEPKAIAKADDAPVEFIIPDVPPWTKED